MKHKNKAVIASKRNVHNARIFIPEKIVINGETYVQVYKFVFNVSPSAERILLSTTAKVMIAIRIPSLSISVSHPFSKKLLLTYLRNAIYIFKKGTVIVTRSRSAPKNSWDTDFLAGKGTMSRG